ncbi:MAG: hypothetical protein ACOCZ5_01795 [bacterium]
MSKTYIQCDNDNNSYEIEVDMEIGITKPRTFSTWDYGYIYEEYADLTVTCDVPPIENLIVYYQYEFVMTEDDPYEPDDEDYSTNEEYITIPAGATSATKQIYYYRELCYTG